MGAQAKAEAEAKAEQERKEKAAKAAKAGPPEPCLPHQAPRKKTITGFSSEGQQGILIALAIACEECDIPALETGLTEAIENGMPAKDFAIANNFLNQLQSEAFLIESINAAAAAVMVPKAPVQALNRLVNLVRQAEKLQVAKKAVEDSRPAMQHGLRMRMRTTLTGSIFQVAEIKEMQLSDGQFDVLSNFCGMKSASRWKGHRRSRFYKTGATGAEAMLSHSKSEIKEALTNVSPPYELRAVQTYRDLLGWMYDRVVPEVQRCGIAENICDCAKSDTALGDEVYVQAPMSEVRIALDMSGIRFSCPINHHRVTNASPFPSANRRSSGWCSGVTNTTSCSSSCRMGQRGWRSPS